MDAERVLRFEIPDRQTLERLAAESLPFSLPEVSTELCFFRVVYYDTPTADLERRNASVRVHIAEERHLLVVEVREETATDGNVVRRRVESDLAGESGKLFSGKSEAEELIRAMIDPQRLVAAFELEVTRRERLASINGGDTVVRFIYDSVTARRGDVSGDLFELEVRLPEKNAARLEGLVQEIEREDKVFLTLSDTIGRARELLHNIEINRLEQAVRTAREVAVIAYSQGRVALCPGEGNLLVPSGVGSGQEACRRVLNTYFGRPYGRLRYLGTSHGTVTSAAVEVWLAEDVAVPNGKCTWARVEDLLGMVGTEPLRDPRTLTALHALARSDVPARAALRTTRGLGPEDDDDTEAATLFELALSTTREHRAEETTTTEVPPEHLLNAEISRLLFDERILVMIEDPAMPLLERVRFLSMFWSRLDDFFITRIAEFKDQIVQGEEERTPDGLTPAAQLEVARLRARQIAARAYHGLCDLLLPDLAANGIHILRWNQLDERAREHLRSTYQSRVEAVITPVIADPTHPFPRIRNLRPAIAAFLRLPESTKEHFVAIQLPSELPRFVPLPGGRHFVPVEEVILAVLPKLYRGIEVGQAHTFRVTRAGNVDFPQEITEMLPAVEAEIAKRPFGEAVRLEVETGMPPSMRDRILRELQFETPESLSVLNEADVYPADWLVDLVALKEIAAVDMPELKYKPLEHRNPLDPKQSIFDQMKERERLVCFPEDSFTASVERLIEDAAADPDVAAIKVTLYRTDAGSRIVRALANARRAGKDAFALVELKASFDERRNIEWARSLEAAGVHVVYSPVNFKVHAKIALVSRVEQDTVRQYAYIGTGNMNAATARAYTDVGMLTADPELTEEVKAVFDILTGYSAGARFHNLLVSPFSMRDRFVDMVNREIEHQKAGRGGDIRIQMNGLADRRMISALYRAAAAGVRIDMAVREICMLRPGLPGLSETIRVTSLLGRFLQHARIFRFNNGGDPEYYIGSADWRPRNLSKRVEVVTPIRDPELRATLDKIMDSTINHPDAWELQPDGSYMRGDDVVGPAHRQPAHAMIAHAE